MSNSRVLVCFNCIFSKTLENEAAAPIIIRNHNEGRDFESQHIMRLLEKEELKSVNVLPYYKGSVYRALCSCGQIIDRKTKAGIEYAMAYHLLIARPWDAKNDFGEVVSYGHVFDQYGEGDTVEVPAVSFDRKGLSPKDKDYLQKLRHGTPYIKKESVGYRVIPRNEYISKSKSLEVKKQEAMDTWGIQEEDLSKETGITTFDKDIFWVSTKSQAFNNVNSAIFKFLVNYNCPQCGVDYGRSWMDIKKQTDTFKELYWHFYREHYIYDRYGDNKKPNNYDDTALSMLQQFVLVEQAMEKIKTRRRGTGFTHDRSSNALYQLNRKHGISFKNLALIFFPGNNSTLGEKLFHGMVWSENEAPDWLDKVVQEMGEELGI